LGSFDLCGGPYLSAMRARSSSVIHRVPPSIGTATFGMIATPFGAPCSKTCRGWSLVLVVRRLRAHHIVCGAGCAAHVLPDRPCRRVPVWLGVSLQLNGAPLVIPQPWLRDCVACGRARRSP